MEPNKKNKLNLKKYLKKTEYKLLLISLILFLVLKLILSILYLFFKINKNLYLGLFLGYLFSIIGFLIICFSAWLLSISLNKYILIPLYIIRFIIYSIPLIIYSKNNIFFIICIIIGINLCPLSSLFIIIKFPHLLIFNTERKKNDN